MTSESLPDLWFQIGQSKLERDCTSQGGQLWIRMHRLVNKKSAKERSNIKTNNRVPLVPPANTYTAIPAETS
jgi:hypothetical protein